MLYQSYKQKLNRIKETFAKVWHFRIFILCGIVLVVAIILTLIGITGIVTSFSCSQSYVYGESIQPTASAIFRNTVIQYRSAGGEWSEEQPVFPGEYEARAYADGIWGRHYSEVCSFTITPRETEVTIVPDSLVYGETPEATAELAYDDSITLQNVEYSVSDGFFNISSAEILAVTNADGADVTYCYTFSFTPCSLQILPRPVTIYVSDASKTYDGTPLTSSGYTISEDGLAEGDSVELVFTASLTLVGSVENVPQYSFYNEDGEDVTAYYDVTIEAGTLTVEKRDIYISTPDGTSVYDGNEFYVDEVEVVGPEMPDGHYIGILSYSGYITVGEYENVVEFAIFNGDGLDVTDCFNIIADYGTITITPRPVHITTGSAEWYYDGSAHSCDEFEAEGILEGHNIIVYDYVSVTDITDVDGTAGYVDNILQFYILDSEGNDVTSNYSLNVEYGTLRVKEAVLIGIYGITSYYDGTPVKYEEDDYAVLHTPSGVVAEVIISDTLTEPGYIEPTVDVRLYDENGEDITGTYVVNIIGECYIQVLPRNIEITSISISAEYNGEPLYGDIGENSVWISLGSLAEGHTMEVVVTGVLDTTSDYAENTIESVTIYDSFGNDVTYCYIIDIICGILEWIT